MSKALQPRINKAIEDRLRADTIASPTLAGDSLQKTMRDIGVPTDAPRLPLYWWMAPANAPAPYLIYGPQERESTLTTPGCGTADGGEAIYEVRLVSAGIEVASDLPVVDRLAALLDNFTVTIAGVDLQFFAVADVCYPEFVTLEKGVTHTGRVYRCVASF